MNIFERQPAATASGIPKGAEPRIGENYIVHRLLKASALCCSWLKGRKAPQTGAVPAGRPLALRCGYRPEIRQWMTRRNLRTNAQAARELTVSVSLLKSIMSTKGKKRYADETLKRVLEKIGLK